MSEFLPSTVESAHSRRTVLGDNGMRFELADDDPVIVALRITLNRDNLPVVQLVGRNDPREQWSVLREVSR
jgi:hypothetical protein